MLTGVATAPLASANILGGNLASPSAILGTTANRAVSSELMLCSEQHLRNEERCAYRHTLCFLADATQWRARVCTPASSVVGAVVVQRAEALPQLGSRPRFDDLVHGVMSRKLHSDLAGALHWWLPAVDDAHNGAEAIQRCADGVLVDGLVHPEEADPTIIVLRPLRNLLQLQNRRADRRGVHLWGDQRLDTEGISRADAIAANVIWHRARKLTWFIGGSALLNILSCSSVRGT